MLQLERIDKVFGDQRVLTGFSLSVKKGESVAIVGESGCGKTTLLRIVAGLDREYGGRVLLEGQDARMLEPNQRNMALVFQEPALWNHMLVRENILFPLSGKKKRENEGRLAEVCGKLGIAELLQRYPDEISGGQAKRVSLARALLSGREILLLDEPLSNIDAETRMRVIQYLREEYLGKYTVLYVSHDMEEVQSLCDRVVRL